MIRKSYQNINSNIKMQVRMETFLPVFLFYAPRNYVMILIKTDLTIRQLIGEGKICRIQKF